MGCDNGQKSEGFTKLDGIGLSRTLARKLIPVADRLRDLHTRFGGRPYAVRLIRTRWSSGRRGIGTEYLTFERDVLPTPKISDLSTLTEVLDPIGLTDTGSIVVSQISGRFTEEELTGTDDLGNAPDHDEQVYYEVVFLPTRTREEIRRRFYLRSVPSYDPYNFQWTFRLEKAVEDRAADGTPRG